MFRRTRNGANVSTPCWRLRPTRVSAAQRPLVEGFGREYFRQLDADDLAARTSEDLLGALLSHWQFGATRRARQTEGARAEPFDRRARLGVAPFGDRHRQRRHAVPGRLDDDGDQSPRAEPAPDRASDLRGRARRAGQPAVDPPAQRGAATRRANRGCTSRSIVWSIPSSARSWRPASSACSATCGPLSKTGSRWSPGCTRRSPSSRPRPRCCRPSRWARAGRSCNGWPRIT